MTSTTPVPSTTGPSPIPARALSVPVPADTAVPVVTLGSIAPWLVFALLLLLVAGYFLAVEQGAWSLLSGTGVHEWVHDGRHLLGFPCH